MLNPWLLLGLTLFWIACITGAYFKGYHDGAQDVQVKWDKAIEQQRLKEEKQITGAATKLEGSNAKAKVVYRTITQNVDRVVEKPVYHNFCFDDVGLRLANEALSGTLAAPRQPDRPVPRPATPTGWDSRLNTAEAGRSQ